MAGLDASVERHDGSLPVVACLMGRSLHPRRDHRLVCERGKTGGDIDDSGIIKLRAGRAVWKPPPTACDGQIGFSGAGPTATRSGRRSMRSRPNQCRAAPRRRTIGARQRRGGQHRLSGFAPPDGAKRPFGLRRQEVEYARQGIVSPAWPDAACVCEARCVSGTICQSQLAGGAHPKNRANDRIRERYTELALRSTFFERV